MTSTTELTFTYADVMTAIEAAVAANPTGVNPMERDALGNAMACLNRATDPDAPTPRCIASQVHYDLTGRELVGYNGSGIPVALRTTYPRDSLQPLGERCAHGPFTVEATDLLSDAQAVFDSNSKDGHTWAESLAHLKKFY